MIKALTIFFVAAFLSISSACVSVKPIYYDDDKAVARKKVDQIHQLYNQDDFGAIYDLVTDRLKREMPKEDFIAAFTKLKESNGNFIEANEIDSQVVPAASFREVRLKYSSKYEKGLCDEGFALFVDGGNSLVDLLMINPAETATKPS